MGNPQEAWRRKLIKKYQRMKDERIQASAARQITSQNERLWLLTGRRRNVKKLILKRQEEERLIKKPRRE
jgi:uncharacterized membrane protein